METITRLFEEFILNLSFVSKNIKNSYAAGKSDGEKSIEELKVQEAREEMMSIVKKIENLKLIEESKKKEADKSIRIYVDNHIRKNICESVNTIKNMNDLLSLVDMNKVISLNKNGFIYLGTERISDIQLQNLKAEAEFLKNSSIWNIIHETPKELAQRAMFVNGDSLDDMKKGRSILYTLDSQKKIIDMLLLYNKK